MATMAILAALPTTPFDARRAARSLYWRGWSMQQISDELGVRYPTIASWKTRDKWDDAPVVVRMEDGLQQRYLTLIAKENKSGKDFKEIDLLGRQIERMARVRKFGGNEGRESDLNPNIERRNDEKAKAKRAEKRKNCLTIEQYQALLDDFHDRNFEYQEAWWDQRHQRTRKIRKSRQVGATWYFAREAFAKIAEMAIEGRQPRNQIFLSASERQALKFRREITNWVRRVTGVELKGKIIMLDFTGLHGDDGPSLDSVGLYPLSTNSATAQGESGDFYFDEFSWVGGFAELNKVASAMATHSIYTKTYFSSASTKTHESYAFWSGEDWNRGRTKGDQRPFDLSLKNLRDGAIMPDGSWQQILTIHDAVKRGLGDLVDIEQLRKEYSEDSFRNLFECEEIDDAQSSFPFALIGPARVDSFYQWRDFKPELIGMPGARPFGEKRVWLGYDPNKQGRDDAALAVIAPPEKPGGKFRVLEKLRFNGIDFQGQADEIKKVAARYNVEDIAIDTTGSGEAVLQLVLKWFPTARRINYSVAVKGALVMKGQNVFRNRRIEFDAGWSDVQAAFMAIRPTLTGSGRQVTYTAKRNGEVGHADIAWAILHALSNEPMDASEPVSRGAKVKFFD